MNINPMRAFDAAPRCRAKSKRTGQPCHGPAVRGCAVCRMHGARGGAPKGERNGNFRHGRRTQELMDLVRDVNAMARWARET
jgi:hypothetical protein